MQVSIKELRTQPGRIVSIVGEGNEVTVTARGKPVAKIIPIPSSGESPEGDAFGMWKDYGETADVAEFMVAMRAGRAL
jgi:prevent-host-death family protein